MEDTQSNTALHSFIRAAKTQGAGDEFLANMLTRRGWSPEEVYDALGGYWEQNTGLAAPRRAHATESSREAFLHLLAFLALAVWAPAMGTVLFELVNHWIPDPLRPSYYSSVRTTISWSIAAMLVAFPLHLWISQILVRGAEANPGRLQAGVRKWLTHLALFGTASTVLVNLISFAAFFLMGELTARFTCKSAIVMAICGGVFVYYLNSLSSAGRGAGPRGVSMHRLFGGLALASVCATMIAGIVVAGTPAAQRRIQADQARVNDLQNIERAIGRWHKESLKRGDGKLLPANLEELRAQSPGLGRPADPESARPYRYEVRGDTSYALCAVFAHEGPEVNRQFRALYYEDEWRHPAGEHCFERDASKSGGY